MSEDIWEQLKKNQEDLNRCLNELDKAGYNLSESQEKLMKALEAFKKHILKEDKD